MRFHEVLHAAVADSGRVIVSTDVDLMAALRTPSAVEGGIGEAGAGDVLVVAPNELEGDRLRVALDGVAVGVTVVAFLPCQPADLPVRTVIEAILSNDLQVVDIAPVEHRRFGVAVTLLRVDGIAPVRAYLADREAIELGESGIRRIVAEHLLEGLVSRADRELISQVDELRAELEASKAQLDRILRSRSYALSRRLSLARSSVSGK